MVTTTTEPQVTPQTSAGRSDVASAQEAGAGAPALRSGDRAAGNRGILREAEPGHPAEEPGDVCRRGGRRAHHGVPGPRPVHRRRQHRIPVPDLALALVHGPVRQLRRSHGGSARQGPGRCSAQDQDGRPRKAVDLGRKNRTGAGLHAAGRRHRDLRCRRPHSRRRRGDRGHRDRGRIGDHRRERAGHSRIRRRPQRRHRRHPGAVGSDQDQDHFQPRRDVPRSHDRSGRGRRTPEDAE